MSATNDFQWAGTAGEEATTGCCPAGRCDPTCADGATDCC